MVAKLLGRGILALVVVLIALVVGVMLVTETRCDNDRAIARARSLGPTQLAALHAELRTLGRAAKPDPSEPIDETTWPASVAALEPVLVRIEGDRATLVLSGCRDDVALLSVRGLDGGEARVELDPGEVHEPEVLWRSR